VPVVGSSYACHQAIAVNYKSMRRAVVLKRTPEPIATICDNPKAFAPPERGGMVEPRRVSCRLFGLSLSLAG
jgi:hypothetical protein